MTGPLPEIPDLGHGVEMVWKVDDGVRYGLQYIHPANTPTGRCESGILFDVPLNDFMPRDKVWRVESLDPLTVSPSLLCTAGHHGFIREGRWVPA